ncbi:MAG TPA: transcriptional regulator [Tepidisphaeraceae bacterium]|jgi:DNA-binding MarR family transcriptional regulator|nr:transcriptional regulator [Tepidisphaeraceae bacterium]
MASKGEEKTGGKTDRQRENGRFAYEGLERVLHEKARLSILSSLASHDGGLAFNDLKSMCTLTDGNLSRQLQVLQEAALVEIIKGYKNNRPQTVVRLTSDGRARFLEYIAVLESVVADAMLGAGKNPRRSRPLEGFSPA